jgi:hypothetical protein
MKTITTIIAVLALSSCEDGGTFTERRVPTTDAERKAVSSHVEKVISELKVASINGDDQDFDRVIDSIYRGAMDTHCKPTMWKRRANLSYTGEWRYVEDKAK